GAPVEVEAPADPCTVGTGASAAQVGVRDISDRKATERAMRMHAEYLEALHDTALTLVNRLDVQDLLATIVARASALLGTESGYVYVAAPDSDELEVKVGTGSFRDWVGFRMQPGEGMAGRVWQTGQPLVISDYDEWEGRSPAFPMGVFHAVAGAPLTSEGRVVGVLGLTHGAARERFSHEDIGV